MDRSFIHLNNNDDDDGGGNSSSSGSGNGGATTTNTGKFSFRKSGYMQISFYLFIERIRFQNVSNDWRFNVLTLRACLQNKKLYSGSK